jgi:hypothetical protein
VAAKIGAAEGGVKVWADQAAGSRVNGRHRLVALGD